MIIYDASFVNTNGLAFPNTLTINATGPATSDGTEMVKLFGDDLWGRFQAILDYAGLTPNGVSEGPGVSQHIEALKKGFGIGPGAGVNYWKNDDPAVHGDRVLLLQGQGILRANFSDLDLVVYVGDANNTAASNAGAGFYHADDAAGTIPNIAGIYLILPDLRGKVLRGLDLGAAIDPDGATRLLGDSQGDTGQGWQLGSDEDDTGAREYWARTFTRDRSIDAIVSPAFSYMNLSTAAQGDSRKAFAKDDGINGIPRQSTETRMFNASTNIGIVF